MKKLLILAAMAFVSVAVFAQEEANQKVPQRDLNVPAHDAQTFTGIDYAAYKKEHIASKKFIPYVHVREADVMWQKTVWRLIDLREKVNLPMYYPTVPRDGRRSFMQVVYDALAKGDLMAYEAGLEDEFINRISQKDVDQRLGAKDSEQVTDEDGNPIGDVSASSSSEVRLDQVYRILVKEVWFFDRKYSRMDVRILGICPIREYASEDGSRMMTSQCFWIYYPELRPFLSEQEVFNTRNDAQRQSFDDLFAQRRFASYIFKESNVYNNRAILEYAQSLDANLESRRIHNDIFTKEHDMWEY